MANDRDDYVVFETADGDEVSNDPRWRAEKTLRDAGVGSNDVSTLQQENEALKAKLAALEAESADDTAGTNDDGDDYDKLDGKALKALAGERDVDISGLTKVGQVRDALRAADKA